MEINPSLTKAAENLGEAYFRQNKPKEATKFYLQAVESESSNPIVYHKLGALYQK